jgi:hypothetical protein
MNPKFIKTSQFSSGTGSDRDRAYTDWALGRAQGKTGRSPFGYDYEKDFHGQSAFNTPSSSSSTPYEPPTEEEIDRDNKAEAEALKNSPIARDLSKTMLNQRLFDYNKFAVNAEIERLSKAPREQTEILDLDNKKVKLKDFIEKLKKQVGLLSDKPIFSGEYAEFLNSDLASGMGIQMQLSPSQEAYEWQGPRELAALERLIRARKENIEDIDSYIFDLVTGAEFTPFSSNIAHTNSKFIKIAEDEMVKEADEEIEDYYNELYNDSEGSPNFGTALEHYKENRNKLTEDVKTHASSYSQSKFKKK